MRFSHSSSAIFIFSLTLGVCSSYSLGERHRGNTNITTASASLAQYQTSEETLQRWYRQTFLNLVSQPPDTYPYQALSDTVERMRLDRFQRNELIEYALSRTLRPNLSQLARILFVAATILPEEDWRTQTRNVILERNVNPLSLYERYDEIATTNDFLLCRADDWFGIMASTSTTPSEMLDRFEHFIDMTKHSPGSRLSTGTIGQMYEFLLHYPGEFTRQELNILRDRLHALSLGNPVSLSGDNLIMIPVFGAVGAAFVGAAIYLTIFPRVESILAIPLTIISATPFSISASYLISHRRLATRWFGQQTIRVLRFADALLSRRCLRAFSLFGDMF